MGAAGSSWRHSSAAAALPRGAGGAPRGSAWDEGMRWAGGRSPQAGDGDPSCCRELQASKQAPLLQSPELVLGSQSLFQDGFAQTGGQ